MFLLTRIHERYHQTLRPRWAISEALRDTAGVVTGAALIMVAVFLAFSTAEFISIRQFGVGLAAAVILDATLIRLVLLPALLSLAGERAWWCPRWLDRVMPRLQLEAAPERPQPSPRPAATTA